MPVQSVLRKVGGWNLRLRPDAPPGILNSLAFFGLIAVIPGRVNPVERGNECLDLARFVGILRDVEVANQISLAGVGLAAWLGDEDGKGDVIESPGVTLTGATFAAAVNALAPASVPVGTVYPGVSGTISNVFNYVSRRSALDYVADLMGGEWRVTNRGYLDAGPASALFRTTPTCVIARKDASGTDQQIRAYRGDLTSTRSAKDLTTRTLIVSQALGSGTADVPATPFRDMHGNDLVMTRIIDETDDTSTLNAAQRAQAVLNLYSGVRKGVRLSVDAFDIEGDFTAGDVVWVWDEEAGLVDTGNEVPFRGRLLNPVAVRVLSVRWPVTAGYTVAFRSSDGTETWTDLTPWVEWESGGGEIEVADSQVATLTSSVGTVGTQVAGGGGGAGDTAVPGVPTFGTFTTTSYQPDDGLSRATVKAAWSQPLNTDGSTIVDGDHYELRCRPTGSVEWQVHYVPWDQTSTTITNLPPSTGFDWQIRAVDYATPTNYGAWSATTTFSTADDTTAPSTPAPPTVAASLISVQVTHTLGVAAGGTYNLPLDMDHLEVHLGASSGFTPDATTLAGKLQATGAMVSGGVAAVGTFPTSSTSAVWVKVVAVDRTGNRSPASSAASATATLIDTAHISDLTASKITAGTMSAAYTLSGLFQTSGGAPRTEVGTNGPLKGIRMYNSSGVLTFNADEATGNTTLTGKVQTGTTGSRVVVDPASTDIRFYPSSGAAAATVTGVGVDIDGSGPAAASAWLDARSSLGASSSYANLVLSSYATGSYRARALLTARQGDGQTSAWVNLQDTAADSGKLAAMGVASETGAVLAGVSLFSSGAQMTHDLSGSIVRLQSGQADLTHASGSRFYAISGEARVFAPSGGNANLQTGDGHYVSVNDSGGLGGGVYLSGDIIYIGDPSGNNVRSDAIYNNTATFTANVGIATTPVGRLYRLTSSARYKVEIAEAAPPVAGLLDLVPVTYYDRGQAEAAGGSTDGLSQQLGLIAEQVAAVPGWGPLLVEVDEDGDPESVNYERVGVALLAWARDLERRVRALEGVPALPRRKAIPAGVLALSGAPRKPPRGGYVKRSADAPRG